MEDNQPGVAPTPPISSAPAPSLAPPAPTTPALTAHSSYADLLGGMNPATPQTQSTTAPAVPPTATQSAGVPAPTGTPAPAGQGAQSVAPGEPAPNAADIPLTPEQLQAFAPLVKELLGQGYTDAASLTAAAQAKIEEQKRTTETRQKYDQAQTEIDTRFQTDLQNFNKTVDGQVERGEISVDQAAVLKQEYRNDAAPRYQGMKTASEVYAAMEQYPSLTANENAGGHLVFQLVQLSGGELTVPDVAQYFDNAVNAQVERVLAERLPKERDTARQAAVAEYVAQQNKQANLPTPMNGGAAPVAAHAGDQKAWQNKTFSELMGYGNSA